MWCQLTLLPRVFHSVVFPTHAATVLPVLHLEYERSLWFTLQTNRATVSRSIPPPSVFILSFHTKVRKRTCAKRSSWLISVVSSADRQQSQSDMLGQKVFCCLTRCCPADPVPQPPRSWAAPRPGVWAAAAIYLLLIVSAWLSLLEW